MTVVSFEMDQISASASFHKIIISFKRFSCLFCDKKSATGEFLIYFALPMTIKKGSFPITKMIQQNKRLFSIMDCFQFRYLMHQILLYQICGLSQLKSSNANNISCTIRS